MDRARNSVRTRYHREKTFRTKTDQSRVVSYSNKHENILKTFSFFRIFIRKNPSESKGRSKLKHRIEPFSFNIFPSNFYNFAISAELTAKLPIHKIFHHMPTNEFVYDVHKIRIMSCVKFMMFAINKHVCVYVCACALH